jgi:hypothetical protein
MLSLSQKKLSGEARINTEVAIFNKSQEVKYVPNTSANFGKRRDSFG